MKENQGEHPAGDAGQIVCFIGFLIVWAADSFFLHWTTYPADHVSLYVRLPIAAVLFVVGFWLMKSGHVVLDEKQRPARVIASGAFRLVRHPLYLASLHLYAALCIATLSVASIILFIPIILFHNFIAGYEEKIMANKFGDDYRNYMKRSGRWLPRFVRPAH